MIKLSAYTNDDLLTFDDGSDFSSFNLGTFSANVSTAYANAAVTQQSLYLMEPGTTAAISASDIYQGQIGDCFLLSPIGDIAQAQPGFISSMIHTNSNGTETVTLYEESNGSIPVYNTTSFKPVTETVTNVFPSYSADNGATQDVVNGVKEIWPQVLEKAVAQLDGGYGSIANGGSPLVAMEELTGKATSFMSPRSVTASMLQGMIAQGDMIVMDTLSSGSLPDGLVNNHAYMVEGITGSGSSAAVKLGNPWGYDQPAPVLISQLSKGIAEVDVGHIH